MSKNGPPEVRDKLDQYHALLLKWQPKINLISNSTIATAWQRHFEDSLQILPYIPAHTKTLFDLGSGAGFPGLIIAIAQPDINVCLVEADQKKCSFLKTVSRETNSPATIINSRIEDVSHETIPEVITARALAPLKTLFEYCEKWILRNPDLHLIFPKGENADRELEEIAKIWDYECRAYDSKTDPNAKILVFSKISKL
jgi:16S rRNA (guanine527-N7)-methyltransferase